MKKKIILISFTTFTGDQSQKKQMLDWEAAHHSSWHAVFATYLNQYYQDFNIECWTMYSEDKCGNKGVSTRQGTRDYGPDINSKRTKNIVFRMFPAKSIFNNYISLAMLSEIKAITTLNEKVIFHMQSVHGIMNSLVAFYCSRNPLVAQQRGPNMPPSWKFRFLRNPFYLVQHVLDSYFFNNIDYVFASSLGSTKYTAKKLGPQRVEHLKGGGFNFNNYKLRSKSELRKELSLPQKKKIILFIGRYNKLKGVDRAIKIYKLLKNDLNDVEIVFIGGNKYELLYDAVVKSGGIVKEYIHKDLVIKYMQATDVQIMPTTDHKWIPFSDIATSILESMALNRPVISPTLVHFLGNKEERKLVGTTSITTDDIVRDIKAIFLNPDKYNKSRKIAKKYYTWKRIIERNVVIYNRLLSKYN